MSQRSPELSVVLGLPTTHLAFSPDGRWLAAASWDEIILYEVGTWREHQRLPTDRISDLATLIFERSRLWAGRRGWDLETGQEVEPDEHSPRYQAMSADGAWEAERDDEDGVVIHARPGGPVCRLHPDDRVYAMAFSHDGTRALTASSDDEHVHVWSLPRGGLRDMFCVGELVEQLCLSPDDRYAAVAVESALLLVCLDDRQIVARLEGVGGDIAWSPCGRWLALGGVNGGLGLYEVPQAGWSLPELSGEEEPALFCERLMRADWRAFRPRDDGRALRDLLLAHERHHGVTPAHHQVSAQLRNDLRLLHPFDPRSPADAHQRSPDGCWLATASERLVRIWEVATGRVVHRLRIDHRDAGEPMAWSPDSRLLALSFRQDHIGVWDPSCLGSRPFCSAYVPSSDDLHFRWAADSRSLQVQSRYHMPVDRPGELDELAPSPPLRLAGEGLAETSANTPSLPALYPEGPHPLLLEEGDLGEELPSHPVFPLLHEGEVQWGVAFEEGSLVVPSGYDPDVHLSFSLARRWAWPLRWVQGVHRAASLSELARDPHAPMPSGLRERFREPVVPPRGRQHEDLVRLAMRSADSWRHGRELALTELWRGDLVSVRRVVQRAQPPERVKALAELAFHCAWCRHREEAESYVVEAEALLGDADPAQGQWVHAWLAGAYHALGWPEPARTHLQRARSSPEPSRYEGASPLLTVMICMEPALVSALPEGLGPEDDALRDLSWYCDLGTVLAFWQAHRQRFDHASSLIAAKLVREGRLDQLVEACAVMGPEVAGLALAAVEPGPAMEPVLSRLLRERPGGLSDVWFGWLELASRCLPELARELLEQRDWTLQDVSLQLPLWPRAMRALGQAAGRLGWAPQEEEPEELERVDVKIGRASALAAGPGEALLQELAPQLQSEDDPLALWHMLAAASVQCGSPAREAWLRQVTELSASEGGLEHLIYVLAETGALAEAWRIWRRLPQSQRSSAVHALMEAACRARDYDMLYTMLLELPPQEPHPAIEILQRMTRQRL
jgi:WD40 repeat protein